MEATTKRLPNWALVTACVLPLLGFWAYGLFDLDEGFYAAVVADMMRRGDWITPTLNGVPWFEKPILAYWLAIPSVQLFGEAVGPRLPSMVCTCLTVWVLFRFVRRHAGEDVARITALVYATNLLVVGLGRMMMTDAPLVLCLTIAVTALFDMGSGTLPASFARWLGVGAAVGLGVLAKGPVALILFGGVFIVSTIVVPALRVLWKGWWPLGLIACLAILATWYVPCYLVNGQVFIQEFLVEQNFGRFAGGDKAHGVPWWAHPFYFPLILLVSFVPYIAFGLRSLKQPLSLDATASNRDFLKFVVVWCAVPLLFFTISGTKLPHYILPAVAPAALLVSVSVLRSRPGWPWERIALGWSGAVLVLAQGVFTLDWNNRMREVQSLAKLASTYKAPLVVYKMGGSGETSLSTNLRPTSHPSLSFYVRPRMLAVTDDVSQMGPCVLLTRRSVLETDPDLAARGARQLETPGVTQKDYVLLSLTRDPSR